jgi:hypothetical protein
MAKADRESIKPHGRAGRKSVTVYLPIAIWRELRVLAALNDTTLDALLRRGAELVRTEYKDKRAS